MVLAATPSGKGISMSWTGQDSVPLPRGRSKRETLMRSTEPDLDRFTKEILTNLIEPDSDLFTRGTLMKLTRLDSGLSIDILNE